MRRSGLSCGSGLVQEHAVEPRLGCPVGHRAPDLSLDISELHTRSSVMSCLGGSWEAPWCCGCGCGYEAFHGGSCGVVHQVGAKS